MRLKGANQLLIVLKVLVVYREAEDGIRDRVM